MFKKEGVSLRTVMPTGTETVVDQLRERFSITTAEELYCATLGREALLRQNLQVSEPVWTSILNALETGLPIETRQQLKNRSISSRGKGVRLDSPPSTMLDDLKDWTSQR